MHLLEFHFICRLHISTVQSQQSQREYNYTIKFFNPNKFRDFKLITWHSVNDIFETPLEMKEKIMESFEDYIPCHTNIDKLNVFFF